MKANKNNKVLKWFICAVAVSVVLVPPFGFAAESAGEAVPQGEMARPVPTKPVETLGDFERTKSLPELAVYSRYYLAPTLVPDQPLSPADEEFRADWRFEELPQDERLKIGDLERIEGAESLTNRTGEISEDDFRRVLQPGRPTLGFSPGDLVAANPPTDQLETVAPNPGSGDPAAEVKLGTPVNQPAGTPDFSASVVVGVTTTSVLNPVSEAPAAAAKMQATADETARLNYRLLEAEKAKQAQVRAGKNERVLESAEERFWTEQKALRKDRRSKQARR